jgi:integrase
MVLSPIRRLYGPSLAADFTPKSLKTLREEMIRLGWTRRSINKHVHRAKGIFKWGGENLGLPGTVYQNLRTVAPLRAGRTDAKEGHGVRPVPDADVQAVRPLVSRQVRTMIDLQLLTGARPGEVCIMRTCDVNRNGRVWTYTPSSHKTQHHGHERVIRLGPQAQRLVEPFFKTDLQAFIFSPIDAEVERLAALHDKRKTPMHQGNIPGSNRKRNPKQATKDRYTVISYRRVIIRACERAFKMPAEFKESRSPRQREAELALPEAERQARKIERRANRARWRAEHCWHPHQLRHNSATLLRRQYGIEAARLILGHRSAAVTEIYAEMDAAKAEQIMAEVG